MRRQILKNFLIVMFIIITGFALSFFTGNWTAFAADTTPPAISSLSISNADSVDALGEISIEMDLVEDGVGASSMSSVFVDDAGREYSAWTQFDDVPLFTGHYSVKLKTYEDNPFRNGEARLISIQILDMNGNQGYYYENADNSQEDLKTICSNCTINVVNSPVTDTEAPVISSMMIDNKEPVDSKGTLPVTLDIIEEGSGVLGISIVLDDGSHSDGIGRWSLEALRTGQYTLEFPINDLEEDHFKNGEHTIIEVSITDIEKNTTVYRESDLARICPNRTITLINSEKDMFPPVLNEISLQQDVITTPNVLVVNLDIAEEGNGTYVRFNFENTDGHYISFFGNERLFTGRHAVRIPVHPFAGEGEYTLVSLELNDGVNNSPYDIHSSDERERAPVENVKLTIRSSFDTAYYGSLSNVSSAIDAIEAMEDDKIAVLDCRSVKTAPKEIFDSIAGTGKAVVFEDENVQWVFRGKTIDPENCKDIDLSTEIRTEDGEPMGFQDEKVVLIIFADNGLLPGQADIRVNNAYIAEKYAKNSTSLVLSYINEEAIVVEDNDVGIEADNAAVMTIDHNSTFVLSGSASARSTYTEGKDDDPQDDPQDTPSDAPSDASQDTPSDTPPVNPQNDPPAEDPGTDSPTDQPSADPGTDSPGDKPSTDPGTDSPSDKPTTDTGTDSPADAPSADPVNQTGTDRTALGAGASVQAAEAAIAGMTDDSDLPGAVFNKLQLRSKKQTNTSISLSWKKVTGAKKYVIYGNKCGKKTKLKKLATVKAKDVKTYTRKIKKAAGKKLKKGTYYKFMIVALDKDDKVVSSSKIIHVATKGGKVGNVSKVTTKAGKNKVSIKKGKKFKLTGKQVAASKKLKVKEHRKVAYESTNPKVAKVSEKGVITGKKKGTCCVYAYAQNGVFAKIRVTVK